MNLAFTRLHPVRFRRLLPTAIRLVTALLAIVVIGFLAWRDSSQFAGISWMPRWLSKWADVHGVLRNVPAFGGFYGVCLLVSGWRWKRQVLVGSCFFALILELGQLALPKRVFDPGDIAASWAGILAAHMCIWLVVVCSTRLRSALAGQGRGWRRPDSGDLVSTEAA